MRSTFFLLVSMTVLAGCGSDPSADPASPPDASHDAASAPEAGPQDGSTGDASSATDGSSLPDAPPLPDAGRCTVTGDGKTTLMFVNLCSKAVSFRGSELEGGDLGPGQVACRDIGGVDEELPSKRYWGFAGIDPGGGHHSLAELTFNTDFNDFDWYNLSHVDAFNLPLQIVPVDEPDCRTLTCAGDLLLECPAEGRYPADGSEVLACVSPDRDDPDNPVASYFEAGCADAYSWSGDDQESMAACAGEDFDVVFCPSP